MADVTSSDKALLDLALILQCVVIKACAINVPYLQI